MPEVTKSLFEGINNARDLGNIAVCGGKVKRKLLLRTAQLSGATERDIDLLVNEYKLRAFVDFRGVSERKSGLSPKIGKAKDIHLPILREESLDITTDHYSGDELDVIIHAFSTSKDFDPVAYMTKIYVSATLDSYSSSQYAEFFRILLEDAEGAVLWHCSAGKDRTGVGTALLLTALGASEEDIVADYLKSNIMLSDSLELTADKLAEKIGSDKMRGTVYALLGVREEYIRSAMKTAKESCGSIDAYLEKAIGVGKKERELLRAKYTTALN